jgi:hypothetical protein
MNSTTHAARRYWPATLILAATLLTLAACQDSTPSASNPAQSASASPVNASLPRQSGPTPPKVPFGNRPCQSLSQIEQKQIEQQALGYSEPVPGKPDRAPATLPFDNVCFYRGHVNVGYMTKIDYDTNNGGNRSTSRTAPSDLPQAFYDKQGGLWFTKNGYYVVVSGSHKLLEQVARIIAAKL